MQRTGTSASKYIFMMTLRTLLYQSETWPVTQLSSAHNI